MSSPWTNDSDKQSGYPQLPGDISGLDAVIIGGGLAGSLCAYLLSKQGKKVALIDKGNPLEHSVTAYTTAFITNDLDVSLPDLAKIYGKNKAKMLWQSGLEALDSYEEIIRQEKISCDFSRTSEYVFAVTDSQMRNLEAQYALAQELGFEVKLHTGKFASFESKGALELLNQAKFQPIKFLSAVRDKASEYGALIFNDTQAMSVSDTAHGSGVIVKTEKGIISAAFGIITTYHAFNNPIQLFAHTAPYFSYVLDAEIPASCISPGLYVDSQNPYHYFRVDSAGNHDRIIIGGEDQRKELPIDPEKNYQALEKYLRALISNKDFKVIRKWRGSILETIDGLPYIGTFSKRHPRQLVATGFSGNGMQLSMVSAKILSDMVSGVPNSRSGLYDAGRRTSLFAFMKMSIRFTKEFFGGAFKKIFN
jgi:glycine/D-amino acid oxidase-like deaminating enzyme